MSTIKKIPKIPRLAQVVLVIGGIYTGFWLIFDLFLGQPIPKSLMGMYMFFVVTGVLMVFTATEESTRQLVHPIQALAEDPARRRWRNVVFLVVPGLVAMAVFLQMQPSDEAPLELRSIHPAPPSSVKIFGKRFDLMSLKNPYRHLQKDDPEQFRELVTAGGEVYIRNCQYCHGDKLDGKGPYAQGLNPVPLNFQDIGTIAQLQESFLFWRIATGGPGLPKEATPWISSMPIWQDFLSEEQIWQVILYLYDYTGHQPRSWGHD
ncbi:MAG: cytochrome C [Acidiferrobacteraceae bacterium]|nr:cytochrome C [Acidiferrobacteraceae bacterium]